MFSLKPQSSPTSPQGCARDSQNSAASINQSSAYTPVTCTKCLEQLTPPRASVEVRVTEDKTATELNQPTSSPAGSTGKSTSDDQKSVFGPALFLKDFKEGTLHMCQEVVSFLQDEKISTTRKALTVGGTFVALGVSVAHGVSATLGALSFIVCKLGGTLKENRHSRAQGVAQGGVLGAHFAADHNDGLALTNGVYAIRMLLQSMVPESHTKLTLLITTAGIAVSCAMFCCTKNFSPGFTFNNAPLVATVVWGIASSLRSELSPISRLCSLATSAMMLPYHGLISGSWFLAALSATSIHATATTLIRDDLPKLRKMNFSLRGFLRGLGQSDSTATTPQMAQGATKAN